MKKAGETGRLLVSILICQMAGVVGSLFTRPSIPTWYAMLAKPSFTPPNEVFAPVWITLFILMGISLFLVWRRDGSDPKAKKALALFLGQLALNVSWSVVFFGLHSIPGGLVIIIVLWLMIGLTLVSFARISRAAGILLTPYLLWVSFAAVLNAALCALNR